MTSRVGSTIRQTYIAMGTMFRSAVMNDIAKRSHNYRQYALLLETGLRTAELIGLTWDSIDWKKHTLTVSKSLEYRHGQVYWRAGPPKTKKSYRTIPLTDRAYSILKSCYDERSSRKEAEILSQVLEKVLYARSASYLCYTDESLVNAVRQFETATPIGYEKRA